MRDSGTVIVDGSEPVAQNPSPYGLRSKAGGRTEAFTAENAEHAERGSRVE
jgi:hypothetical protein